MGYSEKERRNFSLSKRASESINRMAEEYDMSYSDVVENAVLEYADRDRLARIEEKLDEVLGESETPPTPSEQNQPEKEKRSSPVERRADDMFDYLSDTHGAAPLITSHEISAAIEEVWGDASEHMVEKYRPKIEKRLRENGWYAHPVRDAWYSSREKYRNAIEIAYDDASELVTQLEENPTMANEGEVQQTFGVVVQSPSDFRDAVVSEDLADESDAKEVVALAQNHYERFNDRVR